MLFRPGGFDPAPVPCYTAAATEEAASTPEPAGAVMGPCELKLSSTKGGAVSKELIEAFSGIREEEAVRIARDLLAQGSDPLQLLDDCRQAMRIVGDRFEAGEYYMPELVLSGEILRQISELTKPLLSQEYSPRRRARIVFGTVEGDIHDLAKDIVVFMLEVNGYEVIDLGIDVPPERFVEALREAQAPIVGMSGFLHLASVSMKRTVDALKEAGLRDQVRVMIGGGQIDEVIREYTGADAWGNNAMQAVSLANRWTEERGHPNG
jgi:methanogenic corrinoid protein MtbC1